MKPLKEHVLEYLALRQGLGYKLRNFKHRLNEFATFLEKKGATHITTKSALAWATESARGSATSAAFRFGIIRGFSKYVSALDSRHESLQARLIRGPVSLVAPTFIQKTRSFV